MATQIDVRGMTCQGCVNAVKRALGRTHPTARVEVDLAAGRVTVEGMPAPAAEQAIRDAGYEVLATRAA